MTFASFASKVPSAERYAVGAAVVGAWVGFWVVGACVTGAVVAGRVVGAVVVTAVVCAAVVVGVAPWFLDRPPDGGAGWNAVCAAISVLAALVVLKHRSNLARLAHGTENRFCFTEKQRAERERRRAEKGI